MPKYIRKNPEGYKHKPHGVFREKEREDFLRHVANGCTYAEAAEKVGVGSRAVYNYRKKHPEYDEKVRNARYEEAIESAWEKMRDIGMKGNVTALDKWLKHFDHEPDRPINNNVSITKRIGKIKFEEMSVSDDDKE